jgi:hypothetical protein
MGNLWSGGYENIVTSGKEISAREQVNGSLNTDPVTGFAGIYGVQDDMVPKGREPIGPLYDYPNPSVWCKAGVEDENVHEHKFVANLKQLLKFATTDEHQMYLVWNIR